MSLFMGVLMGRVHDPLSHGHPPQPKGVGIPNLVQQPKLPR